MLLAPGPAAAPWLVPVLWGMSCAGWLSGPGQVLQAGHTDLVALECQRQY